MRRLGENNVTQVEMKLEQNPREMKGCCTSIAKGLELMVQHVFPCEFTVLQTRFLTHTSTPGQTSLPPCRGPWVLLLWDLGRLGREMLLVPQEKKKNTWWHQKPLSLQTCSASYARLQLLYEAFSVPFCAWRLIESSYYLWQKTAVYFWAWGSWESAVGVNQLSYSTYLWNRTKQCLGYEFPSQWDPPWYKMSELKKGQLMTLEYSFKLFANQYLFSGSVQGPGFPFIISHGA